MPSTKELRMHIKWKPCLHWLFQSQQKQQQQQEKKNSTTKGITGYAKPGGSLNVFTGTQKINFVCSLRTVIHLMNDSILGATGDWSPTREETRRQQFSRLTNSVTS